MSQTDGRKSFLKRIFSVAGVSLLPAAPVLAASFEPTKTVEFITHFPKSMTLNEYRQLKTDFENKDRVVTLVSVFKKSGKMLSENFSFHSTHSVWRVEFKSLAHYEEWMTLTEELESHSDTSRENAGFRLEIRSIA